MDRHISAGGVDAGVCWTQTELCLFWVSGLNLDRGRVKVGQSLFVCRGEEKVDG